MSVIIFSRNYASSRWCLDELVHIMECKDLHGRLVFPVFYDVDPSEVRSQSGDFGEEFLKVRERFKEDERRTKSWSDSLTAADNLSGWHSVRCSSFRNDAELLEEVVSKIKKKLRPISFRASTDLVGMDSHMENLEPLLSLESMDVRFVGIWGLDGIGKTTIVGALRIEISDQFDKCCFLDLGDIRSRGSSNDGLLLNLRKLLFAQLLPDEILNIDMLQLLPTSVSDRLRQKKVLVILDDVSHISQLDVLAGENWFGSGSRVVMTSTDKELLRKRCSDSQIYKVKPLNYRAALQLFSMKAFKQSHPSTHFTELSDRALNYAKGFPLTLITLGSLLYERSAEEWEGVLYKINQSPHPDIIKVLSVSIEELDQMEKNIFLDIACFFIGYPREWVECISYGEHNISTSYGITRLVEKSLITVVDTEIQMHNLLQKMAQDIAKDSRLVNSQTICEILKDEGKVKAIEGIVFDMDKMENVQLNHAAFSLMPNLRFLKIYRSFTFSTNVNESSLWKSGLQRLGQFFPTIISASLEKIQRKQIQFLSRRLSVFHWEYYPYRSLPTNFFMENIVEINMKGSKVEKLWDGNECLPRLKWLNLSGSMHLKRLPDLSSALDLEEIILRNCKSLTEIPSSVECLHKLQCIDFEGCENLRSPSLDQLKSLEFLQLDRCSNLEIFPATTSRKRHRMYPCLFDLKIRECKRFKSLSSSINQMKSLQTLDLSDCSNLEKLPALDGLLYLTCLRLSGTSIRKIPDLVSLSSLATLEVKNCKRLQGLPKLPSQLSVVDARNCQLLETSDSTSRLTSLHLYSESPYRCRFNFLNCVNLEENTRRNFTRDALLRIKGRVNTEEKRSAFDDISVVYPGSEIPEWFSHQSPGSSIDLEVKQSNPSCFNSAFLDFAFSIVLELKNAPAFAKLRIRVTCHFKGPNGDQNDEFHYNARIGDLDMCASDHVLLWYTSYDSFGMKNWLIQNRCSVNKTSFKFKAKTDRFREEDVVVKRCGVHLVYAENELFQPTNLSQWMKFGSNNTHIPNGVYGLRPPPRHKRYKYFHRCRAPYGRCPVQFFAMTERCPSNN